MENIFLCSDRIFRDMLDPVGGGLGMVVVGGGQDKSEGVGIEYVWTPHSPNPLAFVGWLRPSGHEQLTDSVRTQSPYARYPLG